jgi:hypothetical protein
MVESIKMDEYMDWIILDYDRVMWQTFVNMVIIVWLPRKA